MVILQKLKGWEELGSAEASPHDKEQVPFSVDGFYERLVRWIAVDDQVLLCSQIYSLF
jgi:hypothetical protein